MKTTLVIMAAGIGSRYGKGIKQLDPVGPNGEIIMDYSIHDAIEAGFNKVVFIIRKSLEENFKAVIGDRIAKICEPLGVEIGYAFQELDEVPEGIAVPEGRTKPWGTGQAVLSCKGIVKEPFAVINADDYYGKSAFVKIHDYLVNYTPEKPGDFCMAGFILKNTLSENGGVTRGVCNVDENDFLTGVDETKDIKATADGATCEHGPIDLNRHVSMNLWGLTPELLDKLEDGFKEFFAAQDEQSILKEEYLLPMFIDELIKKGEATVKVLETTDRWFGVTYHEDHPFVVESFKQLVEKGVYRADLYSDL